MLIERNDFVFFPILAAVILSFAAIPGFAQDAKAANAESGSAVEESFNGRITLVGGDPVTCAVVEATPQGGGSRTTAVTDATGRYFFTGLSADVYSLRVTSPDHGQSLPNPVDLTAGPVTDVDFVMSGSPGAYTVLGRVTDEDTGEPLVGVFVEALAGGDAVITTTYTCASGLYAVTIPVFKNGGVVIDMRFTLGNYTTKLREDLSVVEEGVEADEALAKTVPFTSSLDGTVNASGGGVIEGAWITLRGPVNMTAQSGADGGYLFGAILDGAYVATASASGFSSESVAFNVAAGVAASQSFTLAAVNTADVDGSGAVDAVDVQLVINAALGIDLGSANADVNRDGSVNAVDVQRVINAALGLGG